MKKLTNWNIKKTMNCMRIMKVAIRNTHTKKKN